MYYRLIDTSFWQDNFPDDRLMDYTVPRDLGGVQGVIHKVAQGAANGNMFTDSSFYSGWERSGLAGLARGGYLFYKYNVKPEVQAGYLATRFKEVAPFEIIPWLDVEGAGLPTDRNTWPSFANHIRSTLQAIEAHVGVKPGIYTNVSTWNKLGNPAWGSDYLLWLARYYWAPGTTRKMVSFEEMEKQYPHVVGPAPWAGVFAMWQGTDTGPGQAWSAATRGLDLNLCATPSLILVDRPEPPEPVPPPVDECCDLIMEELGGLQEDIQELRAETHDRFDHVDHAIANIDTGGGTPPDGGGSDEYWEIFIKPGETLNGAYWTGDADGVGKPTMKFPAADGGFRPQLTDENQKYKPIKIDRRVGWFLASDGREYGLLHGAQYYNPEWRDPWDVVAGENETRLPGAEDFLAANAGLLARLGHPNIPPNPFVHRHRLVGQE